jgi:Fe-S cluster biogenesis protein NfuA
MAQNTQVFYDVTPNPNSMRFYWGQGPSESTQKTAFFEDLNSAKRSPLAHKLFGFPWLKATLVGDSFVTITKQEWVDWKILCEPLADLIQEHIDSGEAILLETKIQESNDSSEISRIKQILENEIRPAVNLDGGDIIFDNYTDGILSVSMQGACSGCPSATVTLKQGIETRLKEAIPGLKEVISI